MVPLTPQGLPWNPKDANVMLQSIRRGIVDELNREDIAKGLPSTLQTCEVRGNQIVVNPRWASCRHPGSESIRRTRLAWQEFCSQPRDPQTELSAIGVRVEGDYTRPVGPLDMASAIEQAVARGIEAGLRALQAAGAQNNGNDIHRPDESGNGQGDVSRPRRRKASLPVETSASVAAGVSNNVIS